MNFWTPSRFLQPRIVAADKHRTLGPHPQYGCAFFKPYGWDFPEEIPEKFRKDPGNALRAFPGIIFESTAGMPQAL